MSIVDFCSEDGWRDTSTVCPECGWEGVLAASARRLVFESSDGRERGRLLCACAGCGRVLARVVWPGIGHPAFGAFDGWEEVVAECPDCHWEGPLADTRWGEPLYVRYRCCPRCDGGLACISVPTWANATANWDRLDETRRADALLLKSRKEERAAHEERFEREHLRCADELPAIDAEAFTLIWDMEEWDVVIRHGQAMVWREPGHFENARRFAAVARLLVERYGGRLRDLEPTPAALNCLLGDDPHGAGRVKQGRRRIRRAWHRRVVP